MGSKKPSQLQLSRGGEGHRVSAKCMVLSVEIFRQNLNGCLLRGLI